MLRLSPCRCAPEVVPEVLEEGAKGAETEVEEGGGEGRRRGDDASSVSVDSVASSS